jgi:hypothetical protein
LGLTSTPLAAPSTAPDKIHPNLFLTLSHKIGVTSNHGMTLPVINWQYKSDPISMSIGLSSKLGSLASSNTANSMRIRRYINLSRKSSTNRWKRQLAWTTCPGHPP